MSLLTKGMALLKYAIDLAEGDNNLPSREHPGYHDVSGEDRVMANYRARKSAHKQFKKNWDNPITWNEAKRRAAVIQAEKEFTALKRKHETNLEKHLNRR